MSREVRKVSASWEHPTSNGFEFIPLLEEDMPKWTPAEAIFLQMYETCSDGTPISPICATPEELATWLAENNASAFGYTTATYEQWLCMINAGWAPTAVITNNVLISGVAAAKKS